MTYLDKLTAAQVIDGKLGLTQLYSAEAVGQCAEMVEIVCTVYSRNDFEGMARGARASQVQASLRHVSTLWRSWFSFMRHFPRVKLS